MNPICDIAITASVIGLEVRAPRANTPSIRKRRYAAITEAGQPLVQAAHDVDPIN